MDNLTPDELDVLGRIVDKPELQPFFFRKAKGLKWFEELEKRGFFQSQNNPGPEPAKEKGYVTIPLWPAVEYLGNSADELAEKKNEPYALRVLQIVRGATEYAKVKEITNYRTWWQFAKVIQRIPSHLIKEDDVSLIDYWLDDPFDRGLVATELGSKWLPTLLDEDNPHSKQIALGVFDSLFKLKAPEGKAVRRRQSASLRCGEWHAEKITEKVARRAGEALGIRAVRLLQERLQVLLVDGNDDKWSSVWRRAIEEHEQDQYADGAADIIVSAYRDCILGFLSEQPEACKAYIDECLDSPLETIRRVAVHALSVGYSHLSSLAEKAIREPFFASNLRHEMWRFLNAHYSTFRRPLQDGVLRIIQDHVELDEAGRPRDGATSYWRAIWLSAIRHHDPALETLYLEAVSVAGAEPEHPEFSSYMTAGFVSHRSPYSLEELLPLTTEDLVGRLNAYKPTPGFMEEPSIEGLAKTVRELLKAQPIRYSADLTRFLKSDLAFVYEVIEAYGDLWSQKAALPWDDVWRSLLEFLRRLVGEESFWSVENRGKRNAFVANSNWVVGGIGRLIEAGVKSDDHAIAEPLMPEALAVVLVLLDRQEGEGFEDVKDAVSMAINSPRGRAIEALINLTLRACRLAEKNGNGRGSVWKEHEAIYSAELARATKEMEFATLVANYLPNFLYMSAEWTKASLPKIFDQSHEARWRCAMQGYAYVNAIYPEVYAFLRDGGHLLRALDDEVIHDRVQERVVQNIAVAYVNDFEGLGDPKGMMRKLLERRRYSELGHLIWFVWTWRDTKDGAHRQRIFELWERLVKAIDTTTPDGKKIASKLCTWIAFVDEVDEQRKELLLSIVPYVDEDHSAFGVLENIARISEKQPEVASEIWLKMLEKSRPDYPHEAIQHALANIAKEKGGGLRRAQIIVDHYIRAGNGRPAEVLADVIAGATKS